MEQNKYLFKLIKDNKWNEFIEYLKDKEDIDVNIRDNIDNYLINYAIISNNKDAVSILIHRGSRLDITDSDGRSILFNPIKYNFIKILQLLLHFNKTNIGISLVDIKDKNENIPIHYAIKFKNIEAIELLLDNGSDVNSVDKYGNNSLHLAVYSKDINICNIIVKHNINIDAKTKTGENALHIAANFELFDICKLLVNNNINVNAQDFDHEFIPLHYSINLNNFEITQFFIEKGSDPNLQDFLGNMSLHYSIIEENNQILSFLINSEISSKILNFNLYNIDNKIPAHLFFEKISENEREDDLIKIFIDKSNLNFQDKFGNTPFQILCVKNLWKKFKKELEHKKLNIFITNKKNKKPIDFISKNDMEEFIEMVANSYLYIMRNTNFMWQEKWENECAKLKEDKKCLDLIKKKLKDISMNNNQKCNYTSYPIKINKKCLNFEEDSTMEFCTFTGITLDVLIGLIYLLKKHKKSCSTLSINFLENKDLCNYYRSIGISTDTRCEFLNFEIVWVYHKLFFSDN